MVVEVRVLSSASNEKARLHYAPGLFLCADRSPRTTKTPTLIDGVLVDIHDDGVSSSRSLASVGAMSATASTSVTAAATTAMTTSVARSTMTAAVARSAVAAVALMAVMGIDRAIHDSQNSTGDLYARARIVSRSVDGRMTIGTRMDNDRRMAVRRAITVARSIVMAIARSVRMRAIMTAMPAEVHVDANAAAVMTVMLGGRFTRSQHADSSHYDCD